MLLKLLSGKPSTCLDFQEDSAGKLCTSVIFLKLIRLFCVTKHSSEAVRYGGHVCICAQQSSCQNWEMLENHALLS